MIQTEGVATIKKVEPNIITRKRSGQDIEVQDGWKGRILPFELVQKVFLTEEFDSLREEEDRLAVILSEQQDIFDSLSEEDKMDLNDVLNNANTAFLSGALNRAVNELLKNAEEKYPEGSIEKKLVDTKALVDEERVVKRSIKTKAGEIITVLRDSYNYERLNDRYQGELEDKRCEFAKNLITTNSFQSPIDPIENLTSHYISPEEALFSKEVDPTLRDKVHILIPHLIPSQQELFWQLSEGRRLVDIARDEGTTDNAIRSRRRKMFARIKALYEKTYGNK
jgi:hypothetical protein